MTRKLSHDVILLTVKTLHKRVKERFPKRSLSRVAFDLYETACEAQERAQEIARPNFLLRISIGFLVVLIVGVIVSELVGMEVSFEDFGVLDIITFFESAINDIVFIAAGIYFLTTIETRIKRRQSLVKLNELRSLAHITDMHQLTKDPERFLDRGKDTKSSPEGELTAFELSRYLDYCSEMLSMIGKIAVLYVQYFDDPVVLATVNEIEALTTGLSRKIWQKIMIVHQLAEGLAKAT